MAPPKNQNTLVDPPPAGGGGRNRSVVQQQIKHLKISLFFGLSNGKDEINAKDLVARIEAHCSATGRSTQYSELYLMLRGNIIA